MRVVLIAALLAAAWPVQAAEDSLRLFIRVCATCHFPKVDPNRSGAMVAPPMDWAAAQWREAAGNDRAAFLTRVIDWTREPAGDKALDPHAIERFGPMPPIAEEFPDLTDAQLQSIAAYLWDTYQDVPAPTEAERMALYKLRR